MYTSSGGTEVTDSDFCLNTPDQIYGPYTDNGGNVLSDNYCPPPRPIEEKNAGDVDGDGDVDMADLAVLAENWLAGT